MARLCAIQNIPAIAPMSTALRTRSRGRSVVETSESRIRPLPSVAYFHLCVNIRIGVDEFPIAEWPIDYNCLAYKISFRYKPPVTRVIAERAIIPQDEIFIHWNFNSFSGRVVGLADVGLMQHNAVNLNRFIIQGYGVSRQANDPFDKIFRGIEWIMKDDHISTFWGMEEVGDFIYQHIIIGLEPW